MIIWLAVSIFEASRYFKNYATLMLKIEHTNSYSNIWGISIHIYLILLRLNIQGPTQAICLIAGGNCNLFSSAGVVVSSAPYTDVYQGLWGYNAMLTTGCLSFFLVPTPSMVLATVVGAVITTTAQAAMAQVFNMVSSYLLLINEVIAFTVFNILWPDSR